MNMNSITSINRVSTIEGFACREAIRPWLPTLGFTHWVTLAFHSNISMNHGRQRLQLWYFNMLKHLFDNSKFNAVPNWDLIGFLAFPEFTPTTSELHYHLLTRVHPGPGRWGWFQQVAGKKWKAQAVAPRGSVDVQPIRDTGAAGKRLEEYATKNYQRQFSLEGFIISTEFDLH